MSGHAMAAERRGRKSMRWGGRGGGCVPGGAACWEGSMAHLTPACPLMALHASYTRLTSLRPDERGGGGGRT